MENRKKKTINDLMIKLGIDKNADFIGFGVHHDGRDEFLHSLELTDTTIKKGWVGTPEKALLYDSQIKAEQAVYEIDDGSFAVALFDLEKQILVSGL